MSKPDLVFLIAFIAASLIVLVGKCRRNVKAKRLRDTRQMKAGDRYGAYDR